MPGRHAPVGQMSPGAGFNYYYYIYAIVNERDPMS